jgi:hypothetical protein
MCGGFALAPARAEPATEFTTPGIHFVRADWRAATDQLASEIGMRPEAAGFINFSSGRRAARFNMRRNPALLQLNALTAPFFPGIARSAVPVLLPFDVAAHLADRASDAPESLTPSRYQVNFRAVDFFHAGPAGYDAMFAMEPGATAELPGRVFSRPIEVHITGSLLTYDIADPLAGKGEPVKTFAAQYPDMRRTIREGFVRYAFIRFGVHYVVSINCLDSTPRSRRLACREAYPVAERFIRALRIVGGLPTRSRAPIAAAQATRPIAVSPDFTFHPPGDIISGTGYRGKGGTADRAVYAQIRFPLREAPAFANSQLYKRRQSCPPRAAASTENRDDSAASGVCREVGFARNHDESTLENYGYPWRDNYCERRDFEVGLCPGGMGHQGQDLRPATCPVKNGGPGGCPPLLHAVVAVRDGMILRSQKQQAAHLVVNERNEHIRFRYVHMSPDLMDADGTLNGRRVAEGEAIGLVANYQDRLGGTTTHLHFDVQVFTPDGWLWVNPYTTLISAYEHLIGGRGREVPVTPLAVPVATMTNGDPSAAENSQEGAGE